MTETVESPDNMTYTRGMEEIITRSDVDVELVQSHASDDSVAWSARVSTMGDQAQSDAPSNVGLINFLMKNRHGTPFEHNFFTFRITAPIFVFREFMRHRIGWSYNEESGRYRELDPVFYIPDMDRPLVQVGKPGHYEFIEGSNTQHYISVSEMKKAYQTSYDAYMEILNVGVAKEVARSVLPVGTYSTMYASCNARSLMAFLSLRTRRAVAIPSFPQREIEMVAEKLETHLDEAMPITYNTFCNNGRIAP
jgi:thymidylate synthase (FAD)